MGIYCTELKKTFETKEDLFKALALNEKIIHDSKKAQVYKSVDKGLEISSNQKGIEKALDNIEKGINFDSNYYYFVVNSANYLDSHRDVHLDKNWNKTVKEQQGKVYLIWHHDFSKAENIIAFPKDIELLTAKVNWALLGKKYDGTTYSLIYKVAKDKIQNKTVKEWLEDGQDLQFSVRMQYVKILTAFKSDDEQYKKQNENYNKIYPLIVNKDEFEEEILYFFGIEEAKNVTESSILPFGSNSATAEISTKIEEADTITSEKNEPSIDTKVKSKRRSLII